MQYDTFFLINIYFLCGGIVAERRLVIQPHAKKVNLTFRAKSQFLIVGLTYGIGFEQNKKVGVAIPFLGREFSISFNMRVEKPTAFWQNVIHLTTRGNFPRIPAIFIGTNNKLQVYMQNMIYNSKDVLKPNQIMKIEISQKLTNRKVKN